MSVQYISRQLGLPLTDWKAQNVPAPEQALGFELDAAGKTIQEALCEAILHTYDVREDSDALRADLSAFEKLRGDYMIRREPSAFTVTLRNAPAALASRLELLGFEVK